MDDKPEYFTIVFDGRMRDLKQNPFQIESAFGKVVAVGVGDALCRQELLIEFTEAAIKARVLADHCIGEGIEEIELENGSVESVPDISAELSCVLNRSAHQ